MPSVGDKSWRKEPLSNERRPLEEGPRSVVEERAKHRDNLAYGPLDGS